MERGKMIAVIIADGIAIVVFIAYSLAIWGNLIGTFKPPLSDGLIMIGGALVSGFSAMALTLWIAKELLPEALTTPP